MFCLFLIATDSTKMVGGVVSSYHRCTKGRAMKLRASRGARVEGVRVGPKARVAIKGLRDGCSEDEYIPEGGGGAERAGREREDEQDEGGGCGRGPQDLVTRSFVTPEPLDTS